MAPGSSGGESKVLITELIKYMSQARPLGPYGPLPMGFRLVHIVPRLVCVEPLASGGEKGRWFLVHLYKMQKVQG